MPLYSYRCSKCGLLIDNFVHKDPPETVECPECFHDAKRQFPKSFNIRYGKAGVSHVSDCKGIVSPKTGELKKMDTFEYAKELDSLGQESISTREWEKDQDIKARRLKEDVERGKQKAKKKILSTTGIFSKQNLERKRKELKNTVS